MGGVIWISNSADFGQEANVGSLYGSLLFANTMKMLGMMDEKLKNRRLFRLCQLLVIE